MLNKSKIRDNGALKYAQESNISSEKCRFQFCNVALWVLCRGSESKYICFNRELAT